MPPLFAARYEPLGFTGPRWGEVARLPWDEEVFGFGVADYRAGDVAAIAYDPVSCAAALGAWAAAGGVELVSCSVPSGARELLGALPETGFVFVEPSLRVIGTPRERSGPGRLSTRLAEPSDHSGIVAIAGSAFEAGRYHVDPLFPRRLADRRYAVWATRALSGVDPADSVYVVGQPGEPTGFLHVRVEGDQADLRLGGVARTKRDGITGYALWSGTLGALRSVGIRRVTARVSAVNTAVLNLYAGLGFRFADPELTYHWHGPGIRSLRPACDRRPGEASA